MEYLNLRLWGVSNGNHSPIPWDQVLETEAYKFIMPLDPFLDAHTWGMYGSDNAGLPPARGPASVALLSLFGGPDTDTHEPGSQELIEELHEHHTAYQQSASNTQPHEHFVQTFVSPNPAQPDRAQANRDLADIRQQSKQLREGHRLPLNSLLHAQSSPAQAPPEPRLTSSQQDRASAFRASAVARQQARGLNVAQSSIFPFRRNPIVPSRQKARNSIAAEDSQPFCATFATSTPAGSNSCACADH